MILDLQIEIECLFFIYSFLNFIVMAKFNSYLLGKVTKSVGNVTMCYMNKQNIARAKIFSRKDNPTPEVLTQRAKMKALIELSRWLLPVVQKGFRGIGSGTTSNAFVSLNMGCVSVDEDYAVTVDYARMLVAAGIRNTPKVSVTYDSDASKYAFVQEAEEAEEGYAAGDDLVYAVLYETEVQRARLVALRVRGEGGSTSYALPENWSAENVKAYCFAMKKGGKVCSNSVSLTVG